jgi:hypothetical protein
MAERIVSPGVFTRENDLSFLPQGIGEIGAAFVGPFKEGPAFIPTIVRTQAEFEDLFGTPDGTYYTPYAVQNYLREAGTATIVRVAGINGYEQQLPFGVEYVSGSSRSLLGVFFANTQGALDTGSGQAPGYATASIDFTHIASSSNFTLSGSVLNFAGTASVAPDSFSDINDVFGTSAVNTIAGSKNVYAYNYFNNAAYNIENAIESGIGQLRLVQLPNQDFTPPGGATSASTPWVMSQDIFGERYNLFRIHTKGHGQVYNTKFKVSISNIKPATATGPATFTVTVRGFDDTDRRKIVLESFQNVNLDGDSPNFIGRIIGTRFLTIDNNGKITENGDYRNRSRFIYVETADPAGYPANAAPYGHEAYYNPITHTVPTSVPAVIFSTGSLENNASDSRKFSGFDFETGVEFVSSQNLTYLKPVPETAQFGANERFGLENAPISLPFYTTPNPLREDINKRQFSIAFQGGFDGLNPVTPIKLAGDITGVNSQGLDLSTSTSSGSVAYVKALAAISNPDEWDLNLLIAPGVIREFHPFIFDRIVDICEDRSDCFFIGEVAGANSGINSAVDQAEQVDTSYAGTYYPWVKTFDRNTNKLVTVPPSTLLPAIYAANDRLAAEWFAPAGLNRGGLVGAVQVLDRLTQAERDTLYEGKVNPIAVFPGQGICVWGQKTLQRRASALDRINVRRLLITVKKFFASTARYLLFDQNTAVTRNRFLNTVNPYLESVQQRQGLYAFRVVMDETNNTPDVIDRNELRGEIYLQPAKAAEFIILDFNILRTGQAAFGE